MRVLITGAYGLIGSACLGRLRIAGHEVVGAGRNVTEARRRFPYARWVPANFKDLTAPDSWHQLLLGVDAVVNCVGALQNGVRDDLQCVHVDAPAALFTACVQKGIRRVVHISAVGAGPRGTTAFARTKGDTESDLAARDLDWIILRPGLVLGHGVYGGTALLRAASSAPFVTLIPAAKPIHIVAIEDVAETVAWALRPNAPARVTLDLVHPEPKTLEVIINGYRAWLGLRPRPVITLPDLVTNVTARVADALSWLGWRSPMRTAAIRQLAQGINGNPADWIATTDITPKSLDDVLAVSPATVQDRWFTRLYLVKPLAIAVLSAFWILSGLIALGPGWDGAKMIIRLAGANAMTATIAVSIGATIDIVLGLAIMIRRTCRAALIVMLAVSLAYVGAGTIAIPHLFVDPLGSILKIFPIMLATLFVLSILDER